MIGPRSPEPRERFWDEQWIPNNYGAKLCMIAFDPGGMTGYSRIIMPGNIFGTKSLTVEMVLDRSHWEHGQIDCSDIDKGAYVMTKMCSELPTAAIVSESFFLRQMAVDLAPVELIAIVRHHLWRSAGKGRTLHLQQASMGKRITDERLKLLGAYTSQFGLQHARDADRHLIMMIRRCMENKGMKEKLWPLSR